MREHREPMTFSASSTEYVIGLGLAHQAQIQRQQCQAHALQPSASTMKPAPGRTVSHNVAWGGNRGSNNANDRASGGSSSNRNANARTCD